MVIGVSNVIPRQSLSYCALSQYTCTPGLNGISLRTMSLLPLPSVAEISNFLLFYTRYVCLAGFVWRSASRAARVVQCSGPRDAAVRKSASGVAHRVRRSPGNRSLNFGFIGTQNRLLLNIQRIFNPKKVLENWDLELFNHTINTIHVDTVDTRQGS